MNVKIMISYEGTNGEGIMETVDLKKDSIILGREFSDLTLVDAKCASQHAMLYQGLRGELRVMDMHTGNGTFLGEERVTDAPIGAGSILRIGNTAVIILEYQPDRESLGANLFHRQVRSSQPNLFDYEGFGRVYDEEPASRGYAAGPSRRIIATSNLGKKVA